MDHSTPVTGLLSFFFFLEHNLGHALMIRRFEIQALETPALNTVLKFITKQNFQNLTKFKLKFLFVYLSFSSKVIQYVRKRAKLLWKKQTWNLFQRIAQNAFKSQVMCAVHSTVVCLKCQEAVARFPITEDEIREVHA